MVGRVLEHIQTNISKAEGKATSTSLGLEQMWYKSIVVRHLSDQFFH